MRPTTNVALGGTGAAPRTTAAIRPDRDQAVREPEPATSASIQPLFVGVQAGQSRSRKPLAAMMTLRVGPGLWSRQWALRPSGGTSTLFGRAPTTAANAATGCKCTAGPAGLVDIRRGENPRPRPRDSTWLGIAKIWKR